MSFLNRVFNVFVWHAAVQFPPQKKIEVFEIVLHCRAVAVPQTPDVLVVESEEFHNRGNSYFTASKVRETAPPSYRVISGASRKSAGGRHVRWRRLRRAAGWGHSGP